MRNIFTMLLVLGLLIGAPATLLAQDGDDGGVKELTIIDDPTETRKQYQIRIDEYRKSNEVKFDAAKKRSLENKCETVVTKIGTSRGTANSFHEKHENIYSNWRTRLGSISARISTSGVNTTNLENSLEQLDTLLGSNNADFQSLLSDLEDLTVEQCQEDPESFYDAIQDARAARKLVIDNHKETVQFIKESIKTELLNIKQQLADLQPVEEGAE